MKNFECILLVIVLLVVETNPAFASMKGKIESVSRTLVSIGVPIGIASCVLSGIALQSQYRGALTWFRSSLLGTSIVILAPIIIKTLSQAIR